MSTLLVLAAAHVFAALPSAAEGEISADRIRLEVFRDGEAKPVFRQDAALESREKKSAEWSLPEGLALGFATIRRASIGGDDRRAGATIVYRCEGPEDPDRCILVEWHVRDRQGALLRYAWCWMMDARIGPRTFQLSGFTVTRAIVNIAYAAFSFDELAEAACIQVRFRELRKEQCAHMPPMPGQHKLGLVMTHPDDQGNFELLFHNLKGAELEPAQHEIALTVSITDAQGKLVGRRVTFFEYRADGQYRLPLRIDPRYLETSSVGISVYTKQADNEAFKKDFFIERRGASYEGCWHGDGGLIGQLPYDDSPYR